MPRLEPIALFHLFGIKLETAGYLVSILAGSLLIWPIAILARNWYGWKSSLWTSILVAIHPHLIQASCDVLPTTLYSLVVIIAICYGWKAFEGGRRRDYVFTAILWGCAYFIRAEGIVYPFVWGILYILLKGWRKEKRGSFVIAFIILIIFIFSYISTNKHLTGSWSLGGLINKKSAHIFDMRGGERGIPEKRNVLERDVKEVGFFRYLWSNKNLAFNNYFRRLNNECTDVLPIIFPLPMIGLAFLGLFGQQWDKSRWSREVYLLAMLHPLLLYPYATVIIRYLIPTSIIILMWVGNGISRLSEWANGTGTKRAVFPLIVIGIITCFFLGLNLAKPLMEDPYYRYWREHKKMGLWMAENISSGRGIMSRKPYVAFYARGNHLGLPDKEIEEVLKIARERGIDYIVIDERSLGSYRSATLKDLLRDGKIFGLKEIHRLFSEKGRGIILYEVPEK